MYTHVCNIKCLWHKSQNKVHHRDISHISLNRYGCHLAAYIAQEANKIHGHTGLTYFTYISPNKANCNIHSTCYCPIYARNKCSHQIGQICHICKIFDGHICRFYVYICRHWYQPCDQAC